LADVVDLQPVDAQLLAAEGEAAHVKRDEADNAMAVGTLAKTVARPYLCSAKDHAI
jgi:hypothetical protein